MDGSSWVPVLCKREKKNHFKFKKIENLLVTEDGKLIFTWLTKSFPSGGMSTFDIAQGLVNQRDPSTIIRQPTYDQINQTRTFLENSELTKFIELRNEKWTIKLK